MKEITKIKDKIRESPPDIEKLVELEEYMNVVPLELEKIDKNIKKSMETY